MNKLSNAYITSPLLTWKFLVWHFLVGVNSHLLVLHQCLVPGFGFKIYHVTEDRQNFDLNKTNTYISTRKVFYTSSSWKLDLCKISYLSLHKIIDNQKKNIISKDVLLFIPLIQLNYERGRQKSSSTLSWSQNLWFIYGPGTKYSELLRELSQFFLRYSEMLSWNMPRPLNLTQLCLKIQS